MWRFARLGSKKIRSNKISHFCAERFIPSGIDSGVLDTRSFADAQDDKGSGYMVSTARSRVVTYSFVAVLN